jgi:hypothetical protein
MATVTATIELASEDHPGARHALDHGFITVWAASLD